MVTVFDVIILLLDVSVIVSYGSNKKLSSLYLWYCFCTFLIIFVLGLTINFIGVNGLLEISDGMLLLLLVVDNDCLFGDTTDDDETAIWEEEENEDSDWGVNSGGGGGGKITGAVDALKLLPSFDFIFSTTYFNLASLSSFRKLALLLVLLLLLLLFTVKLVVKSFALFGMGAIAVASWLLDTGWIDVFVAVVPEFELNKETDVELLLLLLCPFDCLAALALVVLGDCLTAVNGTAGGSGGGGSVSVFDGWVTTVVAPFWSRTNVLFTGSFDTSDEDDDDTAIELDFRLDAAPPLPFLLAVVAAFLLFGLLVSLAFIDDDDDEDKDQESTEDDVDAEEVEDDVLSFMLLFALLLFELDDAWMRELVWAGISWSTLLRSWRLAIYFKLECLKFRW